MSPKKITDADKLEIVALYRQGGETTASLANRFGVSNSTVSRLLKNIIPEAEYELLIQRKRGSKLAGERESLEISEPSATSTFTAIDDLIAESAVAELSLGIEPLSVIINIDPQVMTEPTAPIDEPVVTVPSPLTMTEDSSTNARRVRRRSSAMEEDIQETFTQNSVDDAPFEWTAAELMPRFDELDSIEPVVSRTPVLRNVPIVKNWEPIEESVFEPPIEVFESDSIQDIEPIDEMLEEDIEQDVEAVNALAAMFGEEVADLGDDDEDFGDDEDLTEEEASTAYQPLDPKRLLTGDSLHIRVTPLSQATLPRTCYIVIDKFAELIVRPLKDFADLGQIPGEEIQQRTLPIFDNHRVAKRFSNQRTQRVIKVPDSKVFHKTCHHLRMKGITRLLVDGSIYSLN
jgi:transposase-like protein